MASANQLLQPVSDLKREALIIPYLFYFIQNFIQIFCKTALNLFTLPTIIWFFYTTNIIIGIFLYFLKIQKTWKVTCFENNLLRLQRQIKITRLLFIQYWLRLHSSCHWQWLKRQPKITRIILIAWCEVALIYCMCFWWENNPFIRVSVNMATDTSVLVTLLCLHWSVTTYTDQSYSPSQLQYLNTYSTSWYDHSIHLSTNIHTLEQSTRGDQAGRVTFPFYVTP